MYKRNNTSPGIIPLEELKKKATSPANKTVLHLYINGKPFVASFEYYPPANPQPIPPNSEDVYRVQLLSETQATELDELLKRRIEADSSKYIYLPEIVEEPESTTRNDPAKSTNIDGNKGNNSIAFAINPKFQVREGGRNYMLSRMCHEFPSDTLNSFQCLNVSPNSGLPHNTHRQACARKPTKPCPINIPFRYAASAGINRTVSKMMQKQAIRSITGNRDGRICGKATSGPSRAVKLGNRENMYPTCSRPQKQSTVSSVPNDTFASTKTLVGGHFNSNLQNNPLHSKSTSLPISLHSNIPTPSVLPSSSYSFENSSNYSSLQSNHRNVRAIESKTPAYQTNRFNNISLASTSNTSFLPGTGIFQLSTDELENTDNKNEVDNKVVYQNFELDTPQHFSDYKSENSGGYSSMPGFDFLI